VAMKKMQNVPKASLVLPEFTGIDKLCVWWGRLTYDIM
jgi:hypothetical protein